MWDKQRNILQNEAGRQERKEVSGRLTRFISCVFCDKRISFPRESFRLLSWDRLSSLKAHRHKNADINITVMWEMEFQSQSLQSVWSEGCYCIPETVLAIWENLSTCILFGKVSSGIQEISKKFPAHLKTYFALEQFDKLLIWQDQHSFLMPDFPAFAYFKLQMQHNLLTGAVRIYLYQANEVQSSYFKQREAWKAREREGFARVNQFQKHATSLPPFSEQKSIKTSTVLRVCGVSETLLIPFVWGACGWDYGKKKYSFSLTCPATMKQISPACS